MISRNDSFNQIKSRLCFVFGMAYPPSRIPCRAEQIQVEFWPGGGGGGASQDRQLFLVRSHSLAATFSQTVSSSQPCSCLFESFSIQVDTYKQFTYLLSPAIDKVKIIYKNNYDIDQLCLLILIIVLSPKFNSLHIINCSVVVFFPLF